MLAMAVPALLLIGRDDRLAWLAGLSISLGTVPLLPFLPFLRDYTHLVVLVWLVSVSVGAFRLAPLRSVPLWGIAFLLFIAVCVVSMVVSFTTFQNIWQLKVGVAYLVLFGSFALLLYAISVDPEKSEKRFVGLLDGFVWGIGGQAIVALVAIPLLFYIPVSEGNDTVFGFGYYDKYKSLLSGPVSLGMLFLISVPLVLLWAYRSAVLPCSKGGWLLPSAAIGWAVVVYLQTMPWLMMATGSRTARLVFPVMLLALVFASPATRRVALSMIPSSVAAYFVGFFYQSLPSAVERFYTTQVDPSRDISDRFLSIADRTPLAMDTIRKMNHSSPVAQLIGLGPGTGGYRTSGFPEPHNFLMNVWAETGWLGAALLVAFFVLLVGGLLRSAASGRPDSFAARMLLVALLAFGPVIITYNPWNWGVGMGLVLMLCTAVVCFTARRRSLHIGAKSSAALGLPDAAHRP
ncbi:hypothetical protein DY467_04520 [Rhodopseudomonas sp. BR0G17]|nr:hypothetical protein [Rhodopseudomonas sp. BR0G17]